MPQDTKDTVSITRHEAASRFEQSEEFYEAAEYIMDDYFNASVSLSVLAAIAASDAACGYKLKYRPAGQHDQAYKVGLLVQIQQ